MARPLAQNEDSFKESWDFHLRVFRYWGNKCFLCGGKPYGTMDAAHVVSKAKLGPLRYADVHLARPAHRKCHKAQHAGKINWSLQIRRDAVLAHNKIATSKLQVPAA